MRPIIILEIPVNEQEYDVIVVGGGPAGLASAIYTARAGARTLLLDQSVVGGRAIYAVNVENYPGFPDGLHGGELVSRMAKQAEKFGAVVRSGEAARSLTLSNDPKVVKTDMCEYIAKSVVVATGLMQRKLNLPGEERLTGRGVSYCSTCDGNFFKGKTVVVVGSGNEAARDLIYLSTIASKLYWLCNSKNVTADEALVRKVEERGIKPDLDRMVVQVVGEEVVKGLKVKAFNGADETIETNGIFFATGTTPATDFLYKTGIDLDANGYIKINTEMETNIPGVFAAGDCTGKSHQIIVAVGQGATAGIMASAYTKMKQS